MANFRLASSSAVLVKWKYGLVDLSLGTFLKKKLLSGSLKLLNPVTKLPSWQQLELKRYYFTSPLSVPQLINNVRFLPQAVFLAIVIGPLNLTTVKFKGRTRDIVNTTFSWRSPSQILLLTPAAASTSEWLQVVVFLLQTASVFVATGKKSLCCDSLLWPQCCFWCYSPGGVPPNGSLNLWSTVQCFVIYCSTWPEHWLQLSMTNTQLAADTVGMKQPGHACVR